MDSYKYKTNKIIPIITGKHGKTGKERVCNEKKNQGIISIQLFAAFLVFGPCEVWKMKVHFNSKLYPWDFYCPFAFMNKVFPSKSKKDST